MVESSTRITKDNLFTQTHANIFNLINNRSNVPDPADPNGKRKFVYVRDPNWSSLTSKGFPLIVVLDPEYFQGEKTSSGTKAKTGDTFTIKIYTQDKNSDSDGDPNGAQQMRDITTDVVKTLNDTSNSQILRDNGLKNKTISRVDYPDWGEVDGKPVAKRELQIPFQQLRSIA